MDNRHSSLPLMKASGPSAWTRRQHRQVHANGTAHPFGSLATRWSMTGPWLCVPVLRRVCRFEDEEIVPLFAATNAPLGAHREQDRESIHQWEQDASTIPPNDPPDCPKSFSPTRISAIRRSDDVGQRVGPSIAPSWRDTSRQLRPFEIPCRITSRSERPAIPAARCQAFQ